MDENDKYSKVDFILQKEYTFIVEQGQVIAQLLNIETPDLPVDVWGAFLDLTPVDPVNTDLALTDYPMWSVHIDYNGSINEYVPEGTFRVDLVSHGNPMKLDQNSKLIWTVKKGEINNFGVLKVKLQKDILLVESLPIKMGNLFGQKSCLWILMMSIIITG